jgi:Kdo2-lipid IVA lauroyltransferase/acyltransferase
MKKSPGYYVLMVVTWPMQLFPLEFYYVFSDLLYFLIYKVARYRTNVVSKNLHKSFPDKSENEIKTIEKRFYHGFSDMLFETLCFSHINLKKEKKRLVLDNFGVMRKLLDEGKNVILVAGHFGNWEFFQLFDEVLPERNYFVYKRLENNSFDQFYKKLRSRAAIPLEMKETIKTLFADVKNGDQYAAYFISDQRPVRSEINYWLSFMNQDTPVMLGTEKIARKTNAAVIYVEMLRIKRGYHKLRFDLIAENAAKTDEYFVTKAFYQKLERSICEHPDQYFWTHKRWKFSKDDFTLRHK